MRGAAIETTCPTDERYPHALGDLPRPPAMLWSIGAWSTLHDPVVAVVGTRRATSYGLRVARDIVGALARAGACIVSGMALGIDAAAHRATLDAGGPTVAVLGTGVERAFPRANLALHREIAARGLLVSELAPGAQSHPGTFPNRNRIIAALARLTIVIEAPLKSGALITAKHAMELGRDVAAVPGPIDSPQSQGCNQYVRDGAHPITTVADAIQLAGLAPQPRAGPRLDDPIEMRVWSALEGGATTLDELCARADLPVATCLAAISGLELRGAVDCALTGEIHRR